MKLVADENIVGLDALPPGVDVTAVPGRAIDPGMLRDADALWVRSVTPVTRSLVEGSRVRFVGTATAGLEHVDLAALEESGIAFAAAPGANAMAVVEYVIASLLALRDPWQRLESGGCLGVVGGGAVGSRLARFAEAMGWPVRVCDPWLADRGDPGRFSDLAKILTCDVISLHCSLERRPPWPSYHLVGAAELRGLSPDQCLVNASRGAVIDNGALLEHLRSERPVRVVLDVWEGEPVIDWRLLDARALQLATPHIAGYSWDAKWAATRRLWTAMCEAGVAGGDLGEARAPLPTLPDTVRSGDADESEEAARLLGACCDVRRDDAALRRVQALPVGERAAAFDRLRRDYPLRREVLAVAGASGVARGRLLDALAHAAAQQHNP